MDDFRGFPPGELRTTPLPDLFFSHVLPAMRDQAELRVTLHVFWRCHRQRGRLRSVGLDDLLADATLRRSLSGEEWQPALQRGLAAAVQRGTLVQFRLAGQTCFAPNTAPQRAALAALDAASAPARQPAKPLPPEPAPPGVAQRLYEKHIGLVTPIIAEELAAAEAEYPRQWLEDAFAEASSRGHRNWRYVQAILRGWASQGRG